MIPIGASGDNVGTIIERFRKKVEQYNEKARHNYKLSFSVGTVYYDPLAPCSLDDLLKQADMSMYEQKRNKVKR